MNPRAIDEGPVLQLGHAARPVLSLGHPARGAPKAELSDLTWKHEHAIGDAEGFLDVVRDEHDGAPRAAPRASEHDG